MELPPPLPPRPQPLASVPRQILLHPRPMAIQQPIRSHQLVTQPQQAVQPIPLGQRGYAPQLGLDHRQILHPRQEVNVRMAWDEFLQEINDNGNIIC